MPGERIHELNPGIGVPLELQVVDREIEGEVVPVAQPVGDTDGDAIPGTVPPDEAAQPSRRSDTVVIV